MRALTPTPASTHRKMIQLSGVAAFRMTSASCTTAQNAIPAIYALRLFQRCESQFQNGSAKMAVTKIVPMIKSLWASR